MSNNPTKVYKIVLAGKNAMFSANLSIHDTAQLGKGKEDDVFLTERDIVSYKIGQVTYPRKNSISKKLFAFETFEEAKKATRIYINNSAIQVRIVTGYAGGIEVYNKENDKQEKFCMFIFDSFILCDWFIPTKVVKSYPVGVKMVNGAYVCPRDFEN